jgi:hypothetical protein
MIRIDGHSADRIAGQCRLPRLSDADGSEQLNRLRDVTQLSAPARLVQHALQIGSARRRLPSEQDLSTARFGRHTSGEVHRRAEVVAVPLDRGAVMHSHTHRRRSVPEQQLVRDAETQQHGGAGIGDAEHHGVTNAFHVAAACRGQLVTDRSAEVGDHGGRPLVAVRLRQSCEAGNVGEQERCIDGRRHSITSKAP